MFNLPTFWATQKSHRQFKLAQGPKNPVLDRAERSCVCWEWRHTQEIRRDGDRGRSLPCFMLQRRRNDGLTKPRWEIKAL